MIDSQTLFAQHQLRWTRQRGDVYEALASTKCHPTAEQLHKMVQEHSPRISLATVYNSLEALCAAGLANRIPTPEGRSRYDADLSEHVHAVTADGRLVDLPSDLGGRVLKSLSPDLKGEIEARLGGPVRHLTLPVAPGS